MKVIQHVPQMDVSQFEMYHPSQANRTMVDVSRGYICLTDMPRFQTTLLLMMALC